MHFLCDKTVMTFNVIHDYAYSSIYIYSGDCIYFIDNHVIFTMIKFAATDFPNLLKFNFINAGQISNLKE